jgi:HD-GYP domain-containing protein (c-di-GMP phosphodiesterase class II)
MAIGPQIGDGGHDRRVGRLSMDIGRQLGMAPAELDVLGSAGLLHDIGKLAIPSRILYKDGELTESEWRVMRKHPELGFGILAAAGHFEREMVAVLYHHERMDGGGYPYGLTSAEIPIEARIVAVADTYDVLTTDRPYRRGFDQAEALSRTFQEAGPHLDPNVVEALVKALGRPSYRSVRSVA